MNSPMTDPTTSGDATPAAKKAPLPLGWGAFSCFLLLLWLSGLILTSCDDPSAQGDTDASFSHTSSPGSSATAFLQDGTYSRLLVEIQYMPGYRPSDSTLDQLRDFLASHLDKAQIIMLEPQEIPSGNREQYSAGDIRNIEQSHRKHYSEGSTLASYNLFVDADHTSDNVLGIAYYNTSNAYFGKRIHDVSGTPPLNPSRASVEATVMRHEYGHLMGLVNNGTVMQENHQENGPHCTDESCVMYFAMNRSNFFANIFDGSTPDLCSHCKTDVQAAKED